jgi:hypothetical protein
MILNRAASKKKTYRIKGSLKTHRLGQKNPPFRQKFTYSDTHINQKMNMDRSKELNQKKEALMTFRRSKFQFAHRKMQSSYQKYQQYKERRANANYE